jgi:hypothetical protein
MKQKLFFIGLVVWVMMSVGATPAKAQTVRRGGTAWPAWDQKLACDSSSTCPRFIVLSKWNSEAVLDRETGLVWERSPDAPVNPLDGLFGRTWFEAHSHCMHSNVGDRLGWRLPTVQELTSLIDQSVPRPGPTLPPGHPFNVTSTGTGTTAYWSATSYALNPTYAWGATLSGAPNINFFEKARPGFPVAWCVRGGQGIEAQ